MKITDESVFRLNRRDILKFLGITAAGILTPAAIHAAGSASRPINTEGMAPSTAIRTPEEIFTSYTNFYEFGSGKGDPTKNAREFSTVGWVLEVKGLVKKPLRLSMEELLQEYKEEERIYRMRCVEGWSMVIPWRGFELNKLLLHAEPLETAKFVAFVSAADEKQMPAVKQKSFPFPYIEGLRLDEAMHPLCLLATGAYAKPLPGQNGPPIRLVVPWKYGFKSAKSLTSITLTDKQPKNTWQLYSPEEYGFYANINPKVPHPRWPQETETLFGSGGLKDSILQPTALFNGYSEVADMYKGMDLAKNF